MIINKEYTTNVQANPNGQLFFLLPKDIERELKLKKGQRVKFDVDKKKRIVIECTR